MVLYFIRVLTTRCRDGHAALPRAPEGARDVYEPRHIAWTRGLFFRTKLDDNDTLRQFCEEVIDDGVMTKDLHSRSAGRSYGASTG